ncbi:hypothetical protein [Desulfobacter hydrogenophilus]|nr:hypothetical protein [Desulfobacter hydrogenophilus]NDY71859.1 hypothetical protein [Desulfobacter hydrogenophilus]QBH12007.1 hypothetical protein EYB58_03140 [Desulfobacter hydrogenophilus]
MNPDPLAQYTVLKTMLSESSWKRFSDLARARTLAQRVRKGQKSDQAQVNRLRNQAGPVSEELIPLNFLMRPKIFSTINNFADAVWIFLIAPSPDRAILAKFVRNEITTRWLLENLSLQASGIVIGLIDPEGKTDGPAMLTFQVNNKPVYTIDGALWIDALDKAGSGTLQKHIKQVGKEFQTLATAGTLNRQANKAIRIGENYVSDVGSRLGDHALKSVLAQGKAVAKLLSTIRLNSKKEVKIANLLSDVEKKLSVFYGTKMQPLMAKAKTYHRRTQPEITNSELYEDYGTRVVTRARRDWNRGGTGYFTGSFWYAEGFSTALWQGLGNLFTMGHQDTKGDAVRAYRRGMVSNNAMEKIIDDSETRAWVTGGVTLVLTIATFGLGAPLAAGGGIVRSGLVWGTAGALTSFGSMGFESYYSGFFKYNDPMAQALWQQRQWSGKQIAIGTAMGFGLGAFFGAAGRAVELGKVNRSLVLASEAPHFKPPNLGQEVIVEKVGEGIIRLTHRGHPGMMILDRNGWRAMLPAGNGMKVVGQNSWVKAASPASGGSSGTGALARGSGGGGYFPRRSHPLIMEPYIGPSVKSPFHLMSLYPGSRVIAAEGLMPPSPANITRLHRAGGSFFPENQPAGIFPSTLDKAYVRFPLPHSKAIRGAGPQVMSVFNDLQKANSGVSSNLLMDQAMKQVTASAETLPNFAPYALQRLKPGGTLEVVFWEKSIQSEVKSILKQVHIQPGQGAFKFELVNLTRTTRGAAAPHSGFGIPNLSDTTPVYRAILRKIPVTKGVLQSGPAAPSKLLTSPKGGSLSVSQKAQTFAMKSSAEQAKLNQLIETGEALKMRGFRVKVHGEGVEIGELEISFKGFGENVKAESKRLTANTERAAQTAIMKGTKQSDVVVIDGSGVGMSEKTFNAGFMTFKRVSLPRRIERGAPIVSGKILFIFGDGKFKVVYF